MSEQNTKPAIASITNLGGLLAILPLVIDGINQLVSTGILGPQASALISAVGGIIAIIGRYRADTKIKGLIK